MIAKFWKVLSVMVTAAMLLSLTLVGPAVAAGPGGTGPDDAMVVTDEWMPVSLGEKHWFAFNFDYDKEATDQMIQVTLYAKPKNGATFSVFTPAEAEHWRKTGEYVAIGAGSENEFAKGQLSWAGTFKSSGTYYVVVEHSTLVKSPTDCKLEVTGKGVSTAVAVAAPAPVAAAPAPAAPVALEGSGPDFAMKPAADYVGLASGQAHWYAFKYDYDGKVDNIIVRIYAEPKGSAFFTIRTPEQAQLWRSTGETAFCGCDTADKLAKDDQFKSWAGHFDGSGTYYIVVEHAKNTSAMSYYRLVIEGKNISY